MRVNSLFDSGSIVGQNIIHPFVNVSQLFTRSAMRSRNDHVYRDSNLVFGRVLADFAATLFEFHPSFQFSRHLRYIPQVPIQFRLPLTKL